MEFEWDPDKADSNLRKHDVSFDEAATAFADPLSSTIPDPDHFTEEDRFVLMGETYYGRLVVVVFIERGERFRIISARLATRRERRSYEG
ncbi:MAG: BrnT family toxin [Acidimicrobiia bacterium]